MCRSPPSVSTPSSLPLHLLLATSSVLGTCLLITFPLALVLLSAHQSTSSASSSAGNCSSVNGVSVCPREVIVTSSSTLNYGKHVATVSDSRTGWSHASTHPFGSEPAICWLGIQGYCIVCRSKSSVSNGTYCIGMAMEVAVMLAVANHSAIFIGYINRPYYQSSMMCSLNEQADMRIDLLQPTKS